jgi:hypothetical protein
VALLQQLRCPLLLACFRQRLLFSGYLPRTRGDNRNNTRSAVCAVRCALARRVCRSSLARESGVHQIHAEVRGFILAPCSYILLELELELELERATTTRPTPRVSRPLSRVSASAATHKHIPCRPEIRARGRRTAEETGICAQCPRGAAL